MVSSIKIRIICFDVANNLVPAGDIIEMHNVDNTLNEVDLYTARIACHYIAWAIKIRLGCLNDVNNDFTWIKCYTQGCHNMAEADINRIINGDTVWKFHALFIVEEFFLF